MSKHPLPKAVRSAINRNAQRLAVTKAYQALRDELEERAFQLWFGHQPIESEITRFLDTVDLDCIPRASRRSEQFEEA